MTLAEWRRLLTVQLVLLGGILVLFAVLPSLDLQISAHFYRLESGFYLRDHPLVRFFYRGIPWMLKGLGLAGLVIALLGLKRKAAVMGGTPRVFLYLMLVLALGPGLLVNGILKEHWGRARPVHIVEFGGDKQYTAPLIPADQCSRNCSFISGHAASAFYPFAIVLLLPARVRRRAIIAAVVFGLGGSFGRLVQGGHFLSDVALGGLSTCLIATIFYRVFFIRPVPEASPQPL